jgi:hypothetical protein
MREGVLNFCNSEDVEICFNCEQFGDHPKRFVMVYKQASTGISASLDQRTGQFISIQQFSRTQYEILDKFGIIGKDRTGKYGSIELNYYKGRRYNNNTRINIGVF